MTRSGACRTSSIVLHEPGAGPRQPDGPDSTSGRHAAPRPVRWHRGLLVALVAGALFAGATVVGLRAIVTAACAPVRVAAAPEIAPLVAQVAGGLDGCAFTVVPLASGAGSGRSRSPAGATRRTSGCRSRRRCCGAPVSRAPPVCLRRACRSPPRRWSWRFPTPRSPNWAPAGRPATRCSAPTTSTRSSSGRPTRQVTRWGSARCWRHRPTSRPRPAGRHARGVPAWAPGARRGAGRGPPRPPAPRGPRPSRPPSRSCCATTSPTPTTPVPRPTPTSRRAGWTTRSRSSARRPPPSGTRRPACSPRCGPPPDRRRWARPGSAPPTGSP